MDLHPSIERVSQGDLFDVDDETFPIYPLGNIFISSLSVDESYTDYVIQLLVADKIKYNANESEGTDDIHANTLGVLNDLTNYTARSVSGFDIITSITYTPFLDRFDNKLAGFTADFTLRVHNDRNRCVISFFDNTTTTSTTTQAPTTTTTTTEQELSLYATIGGVETESILTYLDVTGSAVTQSLAQEQSEVFIAIPGSASITGTGSQLWQSSTPYNTSFTPSSDGVLIRNTVRAPHQSNADAVVFYVPKNSTKQTAAVISTPRGGSQDEILNICATYTGSYETFQVDEVDVIGNC
jgi:hypothetical protein